MSTKRLQFLVAVSFIKRHKQSRFCDFTYMRIHGARGYKGALSESTLRQIRTALNRQRGTNQKFVMFNNTFFDPRSGHCTIDDTKVKYAAVCNAVQFTNLV